MIYINRLARASMPETCGFRTGAASADALPPAAPCRGRAKRRTV